jgi:hypothetical protein
MSLSQQVGGKLISREEAERAKLEYMLAIVNLVLAGMDFAFAVKSVQGLIKTSPKDLMTAVREMKYLFKKRLSVEDYVRLPKKTSEELAKNSGTFNKEAERTFEDIENDMLKKQADGTYKLAADKRNFRSAEEIAYLLKTNAKNPKVYSRIRMGKYNSLTGDERSFTWLSDPKELEGLTARQIFERSGFGESEINNFMNSDKERIMTLFLIEAKDDALVPMWKYLREETEKLLKTNIDFLDDFKGSNLIPDKIDYYFSQLEKTQAGKEYVEKLPQDIQDFRFILQGHFGNNVLFTGKGFTVTPEGKFGLREFLLEKPDGGWNISEIKKYYTIKKYEIRVEKE